MREELRSGVDLFSCSDINFRVFSVQISSAKTKFNLVPNFRLLIPYVIIKKNFPGAKFLIDLLCFPLFLGISWQTKLKITVSNH